MASREDEDGVPKKRPYRPYLSWFSDPKEQTPKVTEWRLKRKSEESFNTNSTQELNISNSGAASLSKSCEAGDATLSDSDECDTIEEHIFEEFNTESQEDQARFTNSNEFIDEPEEATFNDNGKAAQSDGLFLDEEESFVCQESDDEGKAWRDFLS